MGKIEARIKELGIELPAKALVPRANAVNWKRSGSIVYLAGQGPAWDGEIVVIGRLGADITLEKAQQAARLCALNLVYHLRAALDGDLDRATSCLALAAFVRCTEEFRDQALVVNGASDVIIQIFGDAGRHTRTAVGVNALPRDMPVEISAVWEISV
jgi:enamine deaminase RidA (YjgF/YER057c/UK114 family)